jgi:hypothetical protein
MAMNSDIANEEVTINDVVRYAPTEDHRKTMRFSRDGSFTDRSFSPLMTLERSTLPEFHPLIMERNASKLSYTCGSCRLM